MDDDRDIDIETDGDDIDMNGGVRRVSCLCCDLNLLKLLCIAALQSVMLRDHKQLQLLYIRRC